jgi:glycosyltransferase involved in cell wall biosynthesis
MASGLATVASNTGGTPEVVSDSGLLFQRDSVDELAACLIGLVTDADKRADYALKARERANEFPWQRTWNSLKLHAGI